MQPKKHRHSFLDDSPARDALAREAGGFNLPKTEGKVLEFWKTNGIFEKSLETRKAESVKHKAGKKSLRLTPYALRPFVFFEGPPTANGRPGLHHILARAFKDIIPRFKTMQGFYVPRKGGWDTQGLAVEIETEKQLGLKSKKDIEAYGIAAFNKKCKESVWKYKEEWERLTERMGFWLDMKHPYITYETNYIETLWFIISQFWKKKLLYQGHKVVPWCTRCGTALSSHELAQGYKKTEDESVYVKFKLKPGQKILGKDVNNTRIISWTTTPWTLPGNVALAVKPSVEYVIAESENGKERAIIAEEIYEREWSSTPPDYSKSTREVTTYKYSSQSPYPKVVSTCHGYDLVGLQYEPLFDIKPLQNEKSHRIYPADFVTTTDGTGVVHTAVMYGEDDYNLGVKLGLPQHHTVDETGKFTKDLEKYGLAGMVVKSKDKTIEDETTKKIIKYLDDEKLLLKTEKYSHEYPYCWRCGTPLLYYARSAWFVAMSRLRKELLANNKKIHWVPEHIKNGRFGEWLREIKDWNFSRERYWGTPLPVWECKGCGRQEVVGSMAELKKKALRHNEFQFMRHGESDNVVDDITGPHKDTAQYTARLTAKGKRQVEQTAKKLKRQKEKINLIIASPLERTRETAKIISETIGAPVIYDANLVDINPGIFYLKKNSEYRKFFGNREEIFTKPVPGGETRNDVKRRIAGAFTEINKDHEGKRILIITHGDPLLMFKGCLEGLTNSEILRSPYPQVGELYDVRYSALPIDGEGNVDFHRPFIDEVMLACPACGKSMKRVKELCDVWFDSGSMPFASQISDIGYQISENSDIRTLISEIRFPADFISEAIDQTRGWFYTLLAVSTALGFGEPYKNVICLGHINDKFGKKMSKSVGNVIDPWQLADTYGMDGYY